MAMTGGTSKLVKTTYPFSDSSKAVKLYVYYKISQNISNNTSTITCGMYVVTPSGWNIGSWTDFNRSYVGTSSLTFDGSIPNFSGTRWLVENKSFTVNHNSDGTGTATIVWKWGVNSPWGGYQNPSGSFSITLPTIPRASSLSLSANSVNVGSSITANISRASSSFTHAVEFYINSTYYQKYTGVATSQSFTIPTSWYAAMPSSTSCTAYCRITTYSGSTQIGSQVTKSFTVNVPSGIVPTVGTITLDPVDINSQNILVQNKNKITVSVSGCSAGTGSSITSYTFSGPGISSTTTSTSVSGGPISSTGTLTYTVTVIDNRGRTASKSATITCYAYSAPYFTAFNAYRANSSGTADKNGTYIKCSYNLSYASVNNTNDVTVRIYYKENSASAYSSSTALTDGTETSGSTLLSSIALDSTYTIYATITDNYSGSANSQTITIFGASRILNILKSGEGVAFGKMAETENLLDVKWPIKSGDPINTLQNFSYRGSNLISSTDNDTTANWNNQGNLATTFYNATGKLNGQPSQYGFLLNLTTGPGGQEAHQLWLAQNNGDVSHRGGNNKGMATSWKTLLDSSNYTSYVTSKPITLYSTTTGNIGTITLSSSAANFTYLEIFYTDNNTRQPSSIKVYSPNGKYVSLSCIEPSTGSSDPRVYIRTSGWTISETTMTPGRSDLSGANRGVYAQIYPHASGTNIDVNVTAQNCIKIFRILGYA